MSGKDEKIQLGKKAVDALISEIKNSANVLEIKDSALAKAGLIGEDASLHMIKYIAERQKDLTATYKDVVSIDTATLLDKSTGKIVDTDIDIAAKIDREEG